MSDLSGLDRSFALPAATLPPSLLDELPPAATRSVPTDVSADEVRFQPLRGAHEIGRIAHLRGQIQLPASAIGDAGFAVREKKETRSAWSVRSCASAITSARCACCP
jgi:hypothetical protein